METTAKGWKILDRDAAVLWREYDFGGGVATTLVFRAAPVAVVPAHGPPFAGPDLISTTRALLAKM